MTAMMSAMECASLGACGARRIAAAFRRSGGRAALAGAVALALAGCVSPFGEGAFTTAPQSPAATTTVETLGSGSVRVALILPMTASGGGGAAAASMRNAAEMALAEFQAPDITLAIMDDRGSPEGARAAAGEAVAAGAEIILGPLLAPAVSAAGSVAQSANRPVIAFSTDATVASRGVYLMGFLPQSEVSRVVAFAARSNRRSVAALIPETTYGNVVEAQFRETAALQGLRVVAIERYRPGQPQAAVARLAPVIAGASAQADALFIPDTPDSMPAVAQALQGIGFDPRAVRPIGTGVWNDPAILALPALQGGWFAAPDPRGFQAFAQRYRSRYNADPVRIATLAYDAVSLAAALIRTQGSQRFAEQTLTNPSGFAGADGVFRFMADGTNERGLAVLEVRSGGSATVSPAPQALGGAT